MYYYKIETEYNKSLAAGTDPIEADDYVEISEEEYNKLMQSSFFNDGSKNTDTTIQSPLESQVKAVISRQDFIEDCIAEIASQVYS